MTTKQLIEMILKLSFRVSDLEKKLEKLENDLPRNL